MIVCDFCLNYEQDGRCRLGLTLPKGMGCREFAPVMEKFCADPKDFVDPSQVIQMATYFGMKGVELKKVKVMAAKEVSTRSQHVPAPLS